MTIQVGIHLSGLVFNTTVNVVVFLVHISFECSNFVRDSLV